MLFALAWFTYFSFKSSHPIYKRSFGTVCISDNGPKVASTPFKLLLKSTVYDQPGSEFFPVTKNFSGVAPGILIKPSVNHLVTPTSVVSLIEFIGFDYSTGRKILPTTLSNPSWPLLWWSSIQGSDTERRAFEPL